MSRCALFSSYWWTLSWGTENLDDCHASLALEKKCTTEYALSFSPQPEHQQRAGASLLCHSIRPHLPLPGDQIPVKKSWTVHTDIVFSFRTPIISWLRLWSPLRQMNPVEPGSWKPSLRLEFHSAPGSLFSLPFCCSWHPIYPFRRSGSTGSGSETASTGSSSMCAASSLSSRGSSSRSSCWSRATLLFSVMKLTAELLWICMIQCDTSCIYLHTQTCRNIFWKEFCPTSDGWCYWGGRGDCGVESCQIVPTSQYQTSRPERGASFSDCSTGRESDDTN